MNSKFKEFENLSVEKKTFSTALGFEHRSFDCLFHRKIFKFFEYCIHLLYLRYNSLKLSKRKHADNVSYLIRD